MAAHDIVAVYLDKIYILDLDLLEISEEMDKVPLLSVGYYRLYIVITRSERHTYHGSLTECERIGDLVDRTVSSACDYGDLIAELLAQFYCEIGCVPCIFRIAHLDLITQIGIVLLNIVKSIVKPREHLRVSFTAYYQYVSHGFLFMPALLQTDRIRDRLHPRSFLRYREDRPGVGCHMLPQDL